MVDISFVIPFIHEYPSIYSTVNNIQTEMKDSPYSWEIIVAENGIVDENTEKAFTGTRALYRTIMGTKIKYIFEPRQCGTTARNTGTKLAKGKYIMFMDAHTTLGKDSIEPLVQFLEEYEECGCISGLTSWSYYDRDRMGAYYELFGGGGGCTLLTNMHGHYMPLGFIRHQQPFKAVMGSQAYTMYRKDEFLKLDGYFEECRFYPHPEGLMPLKTWMCGKEVWIHQDSWHIHGMMHRHYEQAQAVKMIEQIKSMMRKNPLLSEIERLLNEETSDEGVKKRNEYGGWSWYQHGVRNVLMVAYILGDEKWLDICYEELLKRDKNLAFLKKSAVQVVDESGARKKLRNVQERSLDEMLVMARKSIKTRLNKVWGMENWDKRLGADPL